MKDSVQRVGAFGEVGNKVDSGVDKSSSKKSAVTLQEKFAKNWETIQKLRPIDDKFFAKLVEDKEVCEEILQVILEDDKLVVKEVVPQRSIRNLYGRSVIVDALCETSTWGACNVEVQRANDDDHFRRVRYNASCITANTADPGIDFKDVPNVCVVYITEFNLIGLNRAVCHTEMTVRENGAVIDDGLQCVYVNAKVDDGTPAAELMKCFLMEDFDSDRFSKLSSRVKYFKKDARGVRAMSSVLDEIRKEGEIKGRAEGIIEMGRDLGLDDNDILFRIVEKTDYSYEEARQVLEQYPDL